MPSRYQTIFTISTDAKQGLELLDDVRAFISGGVAEQFGEPEVTAADEGEWKNDQGKLRIDSEVHEGVGFFRLLWERPDGWHLRWRLATLKGEVEADVQVSGPDNDTREAGPPSALEDVLNRYRCRIQGYDMWGDVVQGIGEANADWYADSVIFNPERTIPVVAISPQGTLEGPGRFQRAHMLLRGIAAIALPSRDGLAEINAKLGRLACSGGEVRVYQPGATREDDPDRHRRWRPGEVDWGEIRDECMHILAMSRGPQLYHEVREEIVRLWEEEQPEETLDNLSSSAQVREKAAEYTASVEERDARSKAEAERDEWQEKYAALERESKREIERLQKAADESDNTINELLDQINSPSSVESVISQLRSQNAELREERDTYKKQVEAHQDQSATIDRLTRERDEAKQDATTWEKKAKGAETETGSDKHGRRRADAVFKAEIASLERDKENLEVALAQKDIRISQLEDRVGKQDEELEQYRQNPEQAGIIEEEPLPEPPDQPKSVIDVVRGLQDLPGLRFLRSAYDSAEDSPYQHLHLLDPVIRAISECGVSRARGPLGETVERWFTNRNVEYSPHESEATNRLYPRIWTDDNCGGDINLEEHIKLGAGGNRDPKDVLRIHMAWCEDEGVWLIGHCGEHLRTAD